MRRHDKAMANMESIRRTAAEVQFEEIAREVETHHRG
jgi:hypothetical protein